MPSATPRFTDKKARLILPARFASSAVLIEEVSETELRIRKAVILPEDEAPFTEEQRSPLSNEDRDFVLSLLAAPSRSRPSRKYLAREVGSQGEKQVSQRPEDPLADALVERDR